MANDKEEKSAVEQADPYAYNPRFKGGKEFKDEETAAREVLDGRAPSTKNTAADVARLEAESKKK